MGLTVPFIVAPVVLIAIFVGSKVPLFVVVLMWILFAITIFALSGVSCRNPGIVEQCDAEMKEQDAEKVRSSVAVLPCCE